MTTATDTPPSPTKSPVTNPLPAFTGEFEDVLGNKVVHPSPEANYPASLSIKGSGNLITLGEGTMAKGLNIGVVGQNNQIIIGDNCLLVGNIRIAGQGIVVRIGNGTSFQNATLFCKENCGITLGEDCMLSSRIEIRVSDSHSIIDKNTRKRINPPAPVTIGNHVWIGKDVIISKGVTIGNNCIIGAKAFVNRSITEDNVIIAGVPAKIVRRDVDWTRELLPLE
jgi:acetyltransferase-like isoleucine patch superfamily enzyme